MSEFVLYLCKVMEEKRISSPLFCAIPCTASSRFLSQQVPLVGGFFECVPIVTCSIQTNESSGCIFCVNDVEQACFDEFHQWHPARLSSGIVTIHYFQKCFIRCRELAYIQFYKARNAGFILIVTCAGLFCTDAFVKTDNRNQYSSCSGA